MPPGPTSLPDDRSSDGVGDIGGKGAASPMGDATVGELVRGAIINSSIKLNSNKILSILTGDLDGDVRNIVEKHH